MRFIKYTSASRKLGLATCGSPYDRLGFPFRIEIIDVYFLLSLVLHITAFRFSFVFQNAGQ